MCRRGVKTSTANDWVSQTRAWRIATSNKPTAWKVVPMQRGMLASMPKKQASSGPPPTRTPTHGFFTCKPSLASSTTQERSRLPTRNSSRKRFATVADQLRRAIEIDENNSSPKNWRYYNTLGWSMLQVAESSVPSLDGIEVPGGPSRSAAEIAQQYFEESLQLDPDNKLSHANLCRLHATRDYRSKPEHLEKCRDHGLKAITIDPKYVEGYGDFAVSLVRHKKFDEAHRYYLRARDLAEKTPAKQKRIRKDALEALNEIGAGAGESQRWH